MAYQSTNPYDPMMGKFLKHLKDATPRNWKQSLRAHPTVFTIHGA